MIEGGCLCGRVRYEIEGRISPVWLCHCSKCRRTTGSAFHASAICRRECFRFVRGEEDIREYAETETYTVRFCGHCGSPVPVYLPHYDAIFLHVGALDGDPGSRLSHHIFVDSKAPWFDILDTLPRHAEHAPRPGDDDRG